MEEMSKLREEVGPDREAESAMFVRVQGYL